MFLESSVRAMRKKIDTHSRSISACFEIASDLSILLPRTSTGMPLKVGFVNRSCSSLRDIGMLSLSAASTTYLPLCGEQTS